MAEITLRDLIPSSKGRAPACKGSVTSFSPVGPEAQPWALRLGDCAIRRADQQLIPGRADKSRISGC